MKSSSDLAFEPDTVESESLPHRAARNLAKRVGVSKVDSSGDVASDAIGALPILRIAHPSSSDHIRTAEKDKLEVDAILSDLGGKLSAEGLPLGLGLVVDPNPVDGDTSAAPEVDALLAGKDQRLLLGAELVLETIIIGHDDDGRDDVEIIARIVEDVLEQLQMALVRWVKGAREEKDSVDASRAKNRGRGGASIVERSVGQGRGVFALEVNRFSVVGEGSEGHRHCRCYESDGDEGKKEDRRKDGRLNVFILLPRDLQ